MLAGMPKNRVIDHVSKYNNASVTLKRIDYMVLKCTRKIQVCDGLGSHNKISGGSFPNRGGTCQIDEDHFGSDGCTDSGEAGVQQRQKIIK
ncbi:hypothetical protein Tco_1524548 [Tanacetum coccineum]